MRRNAIICLVFALALLVLPACSSGPWRLSRTWDDKVNDWYSQNAWVHGALLQDILPVYPIVRLFMAIGDVLAVNVWYFWTDDAWDNRGTGFVHTTPTGPKSSGAVF